MRKLRLPLRKIERRIFDYSQVICPMYYQKTVAIDLTSEYHR